MALKIIHTADWHLGQTFFGYDREVEHESFLLWLINIITEQQIDVLLISGDVFDVANPSASAQRRFFHFLKEVNYKNPGLQIVVIAGNHDSAARLEAPNPLLEEWNTSVVGMVRRTDNGEIDLDSLLVPLYNRDGKRQAWCMAVPYLRQGDYPSPSEEETNTYVAGVARLYKELYGYIVSKKNENEAVIAMGHLYAANAELSQDDRSERIIMGGLESVSVDAFDLGISYTALGHIHKAQRVGGRENVRYAGSPLPMSFSEENYTHQVVTVYIENGKEPIINRVQIPLLTRLIRIPIQPDVPENIFPLLAELPEIEDMKEEENKYPYLEVRVLLKEPIPEFRHQVEEILASKAVRLTSIIPFYSKSQDNLVDHLLSYDDIQKINPLEMLQHAFTVKYGNEMPEEMVDLFKDVMREISI